MVPHGASSVAVRGVSQRVREGVRSLSERPISPTVISPVPIAVTDAMAWVVIALFAAGALLEPADRGKARLVGALGWVAFAAFWLALFPRFAFVMKSFIEGALALAAVPACLYAGYLLYRGRDSLFVLSRAVAVMGALYLPFEMSLIARRFLVETVTSQTNALIELLGYNPEVTQGPNGFRSAFIFTDATGHRYITHIVLACTGLGSIAIFVGLIAAVRAPLDRKLRALAVAVPVIWVLNIVRNAFIAVAFGDQWFQIAVGPIMDLVGYEQPGLVSFFIADRVIAQSLSVVALVGITWLVVRELPELVTVVEDVLYIVTRNEYDLHELVEPRTMKADGR